jgi:hypothetical protein
MHSIKRTPECMEGSLYSGAALKHRDRAVRVASRSNGLGPIDLVWVCKRQRSGGTFGGEAKSYFHHVLGNEVTSIASAAAYFASLCAGGEKARSYARCSVYCILPCGECKSRRSHTCPATLLLLCVVYRKAGMIRYACCRLGR